MLVMRVSEEKVFTLNDDARLISLTNATKPNISCLHQDEQLRDTKISKLEVQTDFSDRADIHRKILSYAENNLTANADDI